MTPPIPHDYENAHTRSVSAAVDALEAAIVHIPEPAPASPRLYDDATGWTYPEA